MKIFFDTEFIEFPNTIQLISIGMVKETGEEYYAISSEFEPELANDWVKENVIAKLEPEVPRKTIAEIRDEIVAFVGPEKAEFWAYFSSYDWVVFCWIFGNMRDAPRNFPKYCLDLRQSMHAKGLTMSWRHKACPNPEGEHNALADARWNMELYRAIEEA